MPKYFLYFESPVDVFMCTYMMPSKGKPVKTVPSWCPIRKNLVRDSGSGK